MVRFTGLKLFVDGAYAGGEAWTTGKNLGGNNGPHCVYFDDTYGETYNISRIVEKANELGLGVHYHTQGDKAIDVVLDAIEKALEKKGSLTGTHTFIHLAFPADEQIERMKKLSPHVNTTVQPGFWADFVVYERDLYDLSPEELDSQNPKVLSTWVGGKRVY